MRPGDLISSDLRDRLDAAREHLHVTVEWFDEGSRECWGRAFGFWRVCAGPSGWDTRPVRERRYGERVPDDEVMQGPFIIEWTNLEATIAKALDYAEPRWGLA